MQYDQQSGDRHVSAGAGQDGVFVRLSPDQLAALDAWIGEQAEPASSRADAVRALIARALSGHITPRDRMMHLVGRADALTETNQAAADHLASGHIRGFMDWLNTASDEVLAEREVLSAEAAGERYPDPPKRDGLD